MRIGTASTRRAIDKWRNKASSETTRFFISTVAMAAYVIAAPKRGRFFFVLPVVLTLALNFAAFELVLLIVVGLFTAKLYCYKLANSLLRHMPFAR